MDRLASHKEEISCNLDQYLSQQGKLTQLIDSLGTQLQRLESTSVQNIAGQECVTP